MLNVEFNNFTLAIKTCKQLVIGNDCSKERYDMIESIVDD